MCTQMNILKGQMDNKTLDPHDSMKLQYIYQARLYRHGQMCHPNCSNAILEIDVFQLHQCSVCEFNTAIYSR